MFPLHRSTPIPICSHISLNSKRRLVVVITFEYKVKFQNLTFTHLFPASLYARYCYYFVPLRMLDSMICLILFLCVYDYE